MTEEDIHKIREKILEKIGRTPEERKQKIIDALNSMKPFKDSKHVPPVPKMDTQEEYDEYVVKNFVRCGAIPKDKLVVGKTYEGDCRNSSTAVWNGTNFVYQRDKFGYVYNETINHFQDDNGYDLFVPIKELD